MIYKNKTNNKVSIVSTKDTNIIVGVASHDKNIHDSKTLTVAISHANSNRNKPIKQAVCDRGYVGANIILPKKALKRDNRYQRDKKRKLCKRRAAIEPIIGHFNRILDFLETYSKDKLVMRLMF